MKSSLALTSILFATTLVSGLPPQQPADSALIERIPSANSFDPALSQNLDSHQLEKRRGGGGGRGGGSSGGKGSGSGNGGRATSSYSFSPQSNLGGRTRDGSGSPPSYGNRYVGGAAVPYTAGGKTPSRGFTPFLLPVAAFAFFPALWLFPVYAYPYYGYGGYHWLGEDGRNRTANVTCLCQEYSVCGCDPGQDNETILVQQLTDGKGSGAPVNTTQVKVVDFGDGNTTAYINGTLDNGTTASGGTEPSSEDQISAAVQLLANYGGYWMAVVVASLFITVT